MSARSQSLIPDLLTGLFVIAVVGLLAFFTIVISGVDLLSGHSATTREATFKDVGHLRVQDPVTVRGMKVGAVQDLTLLRDHVIVTFTLDADVPLQADATASVASTSVLGGASLVIDQGTSAHPLPSGDILPGIAPVDVMDELGALVGDLRKSFDPADLRTLLGNLRGASVNLADITGRIRSGQGLVGQLLTDDSALSDTFQATVANLRTASERLNDPATPLGKLLSGDTTLIADIEATAANLNTVSTRLAQGQGTLGKLLAEDDSTYQDLQAVLANLRTATTKLNDPNGGLGKLLSDDSTLITDLERSAANLNAITAKLNNGQGTLGRLVNDDTLAKETEAAVKDIRQIIDNLRDTAPITTFSSLFFSGL